MTTQISMLNLSKYGKDVVYTPDDIAGDIVRHFAPSGVCLDPCAGDGAFYKHLPEPKEWCEIERGRDFFQWSMPVDWIVSNPPYTVFNDWLRHSFTLARDIVYLIPVNKIFNDYGMMTSISRWGGVKEVYVIGRGDKINFPMGYAVGAVHLQRDYRGGMMTTFRSHA